MSISATTRVVRVGGELFVSVSTIDELVSSMILDSPEAWRVEIETLAVLAKNARSTAKQMNI